MSEWGENIYCGVEVSKVIGEEVGIKKRKRWRERNRARKVNRKKME